MSNLKVNSTSTQSHNFHTDQNEQVDTRDQQLFEDSMQEKRNANDELNKNKPGNDDSRTTASNNAKSNNDKKHFEKDSHTKNSMQELNDQQLSESATEELKKHNALNKHELKNKYAVSESKNTTSELEGKIDMQAMLESQHGLFQQLQNNQVSNTVKLADTEQLSSTSLNDETITKIVDSILVSREDALNQEVRITVNQDILPKTEIIINRDLQGHLQVALVSDDPRSTQALVQGQHNLRALLQKSENNVTVKVQSMTESQAEHNDSQRRSRTFIEAQTENA